MRTIITCSLYIFYPILEGQKGFFKELFRKFFIWLWTIWHRILNFLKTQIATKAKNKDKEEKNRHWGCREGHGAYFRDVVYTDLMVHTDADL